MAEIRPIDDHPWRRMVRQHAESLLAAGVEWIERPAGTGDHAGPSATQASAPAPVTGTDRVPPESPSGVVAGNLFAQEAFRGPTLNRQQKRQALEQLNRSEVVGCTRCPALVQNRSQTVFGVGNPSAELVFVGEAPGADEDAQGEPFVGAAGQLLTRIIEACGMKREEVYICNVLKCRPPGNRTPLPDEIANCMPYLERQLEIIRPKFICALGAVAAQALLKTTQSIGKLRGRFLEYNGIPVICTYHPAYLLRNPAAKRPVWEDMKMLLAKMGRPIPKR